MRCHKELVALARVKITCAIGSLQSCDDFEPTGIITIKWNNTWPESVLREAISIPLHVPIAAGLFAWDIKFHAPAKYSREETTRLRDEYRKWYASKSNSDPPSEAEHCYFNEPAHYMKITIKFI